MNWILQQPLVIIVAGLAVELILFLVLQQTGKKWVVWTMAGVAVLLGVSIFVERTIVTPEEAIRSTLHEVAAAAQRNDADAIVGYISSRAPERQEEARRRFKQVTLKEVSVKKIADLSVGNPPERASAIVRVKAVGSVSGFEGMALREFNVSFVLEDGVWKVRGWDELGDPLLPQR